MFLFDSYCVVVAFAVLMICCFVVVVGFRHWLFVWDCGFASGFALWCWV